MIAMSSADARFLVKDATDVQNTQTLWEATWPFPVHDTEQSVLWLVWSGLRDHQPKHKVNDTHHRVIPASWGENCNPNKLCIVDVKQFGSFHVASSDLN